MPQASFLLRYLFTPCTGNEENDHVLLENIIQALTANPVILGPDTQSGMILTVKLDSLSLDDLSELWTALETPLRLSASFTVASSGLGYASEDQATKKPSVTPSSTPAQNVMKIYQVVLKTFIEQSDSWGKRNIFQKQWVLKDFRENAGMSVEEMRTNLKALGDNLQTGAPTDRFRDMLKQLATYYEHQREMLKGFEKVQAKRQEGLDAISSWIIDVKALAEALGS
jgi:hypothetical protein